MKLYIQIVLLSLGTFPAFAQSNFINFADSNFEKTLRRNVERDWIYLPSYTGPEYQFTQAISIFHLLQGIKAASFLSRSEKRYSG